jgi:hypothetical protein
LHEAALAFDWLAPNHFGAFIKALMDGQETFFGRPESCVPSFILA